MPETELCHVPVKSLAGLSCACNDGKSAENNNRNNKIGVIILNDVAALFVNLKNKPATFPFSIVFTYPLVVTFFTYRMNIHLTFKNP